MTPIAAVGVICFRGDDVLLIRRGTPPLLDQYSLPGGKLKHGERLVDCAVRELREETGVEAAMLGLVDVVDGLFDGATDRHFVLIDYAMRWTRGEPRAGDDAAEARFVNPTALAATALWAPTAAVIAKARTMYGSDR